MIASVVGAVGSADRVAEHTCYFALARPAHNPRIARPGSTRFVVPRHENRGYAFGGLRDRCLGRGTPGRVAPWTVHNT